MYDKICYRKGACFLKQIDVFVGREIMREGIKIYFRDFKFKTTTLQDFINCLKTALQMNYRNIDLQAWVDSWLTKSGVNELTPSFHDKGG
jgi:aminopeptidase N